MIDHTNPTPESQVNSSLPSEPVYYIYFVAQAEADYIKIGITADVKIRLKQLQTGNPQRLVVLRVITSPSLKNARAIEALIHERYDSMKYRAQGEWFAINPARLIHDINFAVELGLLLDEADANIIDAPRDAARYNDSAWIGSFDDHPLGTGREYVGYTNGEIVEKFLYEALNKDPKQVEEVEDEIGEESEA